jgi:hypothetical protein
VNQQSKKIERIASDSQRREQREQNHEGYDSDEMGRRGMERGRGERERERSGVKE